MKLTMDCQEVEDKADCHRDHYALFKVPRAVTAAELKAARKRLLLKLHPDKNRDQIELATEKFKEVRHAYSVLSDPKERSWYDSHREEILRGGTGEPESDDEEDEVGKSGGQRAPARRPPQGPNVMAYYARCVAPSAGLNRVSGL